MSDKPTKAIIFEAQTTAPGFRVSMDGKALEFDDQGMATLERPVGWDCMVYYELIEAELGDTFTLKISEASTPLEVTVKTESRSVFGFTGFVISE